VSDLQPLAQLKALTQLSLDFRDTAVSDLQPLAQLKALTQLSLDFRDTEVSDLQPALNLINLRTLSIKTATRTQRMSLRDIPSVVELTF
jgi:hypothetical protein